MCISSIQNIQVLNFDICFIPFCRLENFHGRSKFIFNSFIWCINLTREHVYTIVCFSIAGNAVLAVIMFGERVQKLE